MLVKHGLAALPRDVIQEQATRHRAERRHRRVIRHARGIADRKIDQEQIVDDRKRENRRIQKRDQEKAQAARCGDNGLEPVGQMNLRCR